MLISELFDLSPFGTKEVSNIDGVPIYSSDKLINFVTTVQTSSFTKPIASKIIEDMNSHTIIVSMKITALLNLLDDSDILYLKGSFTVTDSVDFDNKKDSDSIR